jgi:hypothetical protein
LKGTTVIAIDKQAHIAVGAALTLALGYLIPPIFAALIAMVVGFFKEVYDSKHPENHTSDFADFAFTVLGAFIAAAYLISLNLIFR